MAGKRVAVLDPDGQFGTVDEADVPKLPEGARVLNKQQLAERAADEEYAKKSTAEKATSLASIAGPLPFAARTAVKLAQGKGAEIAPSLPPAVESYAQGVSETFAGGVPTLALEKATELAGGKEAGKAYVEKVDAAKEGYAGSHALGQVAGVAGSIAAGGPKGAGTLGKAIPGVGIGAAGGAIEGGVAKALGGLASKGALGRAAATGASMAARGAFEGAALGGASQATDNMLHGDPIVGEKLYAAIGHGALAGGALGGILGTAGSLVASGGRAARGAFSRGAAAEAPLSLGPGGRAAEGQPVRINPDAGLGEAAPEAERAFGIGPEKQPTGLRPNVYQRGGAPKASRSPIDWETRTRQYPEPGHGLPETTFQLNPDAGLSIPARAKAANEAQDVFRLLKGKRQVEIGPTGEAVEVGAGPVQIGEAADAVAAREATTPIKGKPLGALDLLTQPNAAARSLANDQTWRAVGGGFGLQSTKYAKEAAKYFPGGTNELGEIGRRYGLIDVSETATPMQAAYKAAKSGTPAEILPKAQAAFDDVGSKIGAITDASGASIEGKAIERVIDAVAKQYEGAAATRPVGRSIRTFGAELLDSLGIRDAKSIASVQDVLRERKAIDRLVFQDAPTLDPKVALEAKRALRGKLEDVITGALDDASGKVKGDLAKEYKGLKRDYHGLRILSEAAEDSAARSAKAATLGLGEKFALAASIAGGHFGAGPILAAGGKVIRERGNAAAAAFLARAADNGSIEAVVSKFNARVRQSAAGALREAPKSTTEVPKKAPKAAAAEAQEGKRAVAETQTKAQKIIAWVGDMRANPDQLQRALEREQTAVSHAAGSQTADSYSAAAIRALSFVASYVPARERRDPLDPRSVPQPTYDEADRLVRAAKYAAQPTTIFDDFERGRVTPEGLKAAQILAPEAFADFQVELQQHVEAHMMRGLRLSQTQRLRIDKLLGYPAGADLRPDAIARLQANLMKAPDEPPPAPGATGHKPVDLKVQQTGFDAVEARHATG